MIVTRAYRQAITKWSVQLIGFLLLLVLAIILGGSVEMLSLSKIWMVGIPLIIGSYLWWKAKPQQVDVLNYIHQHIPSSEYSLDLLEKQPDQLKLLEKIQVEKIQAILSTKKVGLPFDLKLFGQLGLLSVGAIVLCFLSSYGHLSVDLGDEEIMPNEEIETIVSIENDSVSILKNSIKINPPSYTSRKAYRQQSLDIDVLEGSRVGWQIAWTGTEESANLLFEDEEEVVIKNSTNYNKTFFNPSYYRYKIQGPTNNIESPYGAIKIQMDEPAKVVIKDIEEYQRLEYKSNYNIDFGISIQDEYGIEAAHIIATVAKGQGESVKFREKKFDLKDFTSGQLNYNGAYSFSTSALSMEPGDELYFYVTAKDNCPYRKQWSKSPTYFVMLEDTATYFFAEDQGMQVDLMPDFFRSQRQIIIDSEKLLSERASISIEDFNNRSNELGYDQKLLRLKYGQFLGEESESGIAIENEIELEEEHDHDDHAGHDHAGHDHEGHDHEESSAAAWSKDVIGDFMHDHDHEEEHGELLSSKGTEQEDPTRPSWVAELSHNHDNMEEATFHQLATKSKLRAAMSEMWDAELHLRLYDPKTSLPYQERSLKLLQDIKNHARIYVHRIGFDPPAIKEEESRLSGNQEEITSPTEQRELVFKDEQEIYSVAYSMISDNRFKGDLSGIEAAANAIAKRVLTAPNLLPLLTDMQRLISGQRDTDLISRLKRGLATLLDSDVSEPTPVQVFNHPITASIITELRKAR